MSSPIPPFLLQLVDAAGVVIRTRAGGRHEAALVESIMAKVAATNVGAFRTQAAVERIVRRAIIDALQEVKVQDPLDVVAD